MTLDMTLYVVERFHGYDLAARLAPDIEYDWHDDAS